MAAREQSHESVAALRQLLHEFMACVLQRADHRRLLQAGQRELFFYDTQLEVSRKNFQSTAINYTAELALSWQTLCVGPLLCDGYLGSPKDLSDLLLLMLERNHCLWDGKCAHFYADKQA